MALLPSEACMTARKVIDDICEEVCVDGTGTWVQNADANSYEHYIKSIVAFTVASGLIRGDHN